MFAVAGYLTVVCDAFIINKLTDFVLIGLLCGTVQIQLSDLAGACWKFICLDEGKGQFERTNKRIQLPPDCITSI